MQGHEINQHPLVSIGMLVYNGERFLAQSLESLLSQEYKNFELIISDNASEDRSGEICLKYQARDSRIQYSRNETNMGSIYNGTKVRDLARGKYFMWASDHDLWHPTLLTKAVAVMENDPEVILCYSRAQRIDKEGNFLCLGPDYLDTRGMSPPARFLHLIGYHCGGELIYGLFRRENLSRIKTKAIWASDIYILSALALEGTFVHLPEVLFSLRKIRDEEIESHKKTQAHNLDPARTKEMLAMDLHALWRELGEECLSVVQGSSFPDLEKEVLLEETKNCFTTRFEVQWPGSPEAAENKGIRGQVDAPALLTDTAAKEAWRERRAARLARKEAKQRIVEEAMRRRQYWGGQWPLVSVIVPTYNRPDTLGAALQSILNQTYKNHEVIVVNDGGLDVSGIVGWLNQQGNITYVQHDRRRGRAAACNTGLKLARGQYIAYLDDDSLFYPEHLAVLATVLVDSEYRVAYTDALRARLENQCGRNVVAAKDLPYSYEFDQERLLVANQFPSLCLMHERSCLEQAGLFDESLSSHEDWDLLIRLSFRDKFFHIKRVTCEFTQGQEDDATVGQKQADLVRTMEIVHGKYQDHLQDKPQIQEQQRQFLQHQKDAAQRTCAGSRPETPNPDQLLQLTNEALEREDWEAAETCLRDLIRSHPDLLDGYLSLSDVLTLQGKDQDAREVLRAARELAPEALPLLKRLGANCRKRGDFSGALTAFTKVLEHTPRDTEALCQLGATYLDLGLLQEAQTHLTAALQINPTNLDARKLLAQVAQYLASGETSDPVSSQAPAPDAGHRAPEKTGTGQAGEFVNICMVTYNRLDFTKQAIDALVRLTHYPYVLTVVDNGSTDGTPAYLESLKARGVIKNLILLDENLGVAKASNLAWSLEPEAACYLKLDNDIILQKDGWLEDMVAVINQVPEIGVLAYSFEPRSYPLEVWHDVTIRIKKGTLGGACLLIPKRTERLLGYFCEEYGLYDEEDADYGVRVLAANLLNAYMEDEHVGLAEPGAPNPQEASPATGVQEESASGNYKQFKHQSKRAHMPLFIRNRKAYLNGSKPLFIPNPYLRPQQPAAPGPVTAPSQPESDCPAPAGESDGTPPQSPLSSDFSESLASIIIPVFNNLSLTRQCLESIEANTDAPHEIIVVDNGSSDGTRDYLLQLEAQGRLRVISNRLNLGFARASNQGAQEARGHFLVFLNNDTIVQPGWLEELVACARKEEKAGAIGAKLLYLDDTIQHAGVVFNEEITQILHIYQHYDKDHPAVNQGREFQAVTAACMLVRKDRFFEVGGFEECYQNGYEDVDLCFKLREQGYKVIYNPRTAVYHLECQTQGRHDRDAENGRTFKLKWSGKIRGDAAKYYQEDNITVEVMAPPDADPYIVAHDGNDNVFWQEAQRYRQQGLWDQAEASYRRALGFNPFDPRKLTIGRELVNLYETQGKLDQAQRLRQIMAAQASRFNRQQQAQEASRPSAPEQADGDRACRQGEAPAVQRPRPRPQGLAPGNGGGPPPPPEASPQDFSSNPMGGLSSIIIPVFNNLALTRQCLESVWRDTNAPCEIIVVDNASTDCTRDYLHRLEAAGRVRVITNRRNLGFSRASNQGARAARGEYLLFLNNDTIVQPGWLEAMVACARKDAKIGVVGAKLLYPDDTIQHAGVAFNDEKLVHHIYRQYDKDHPAVNKEREFQAVTAACALIKKDLFFQAGCFDESYQNGFEDVDLCFRLRQQGYKVVYTPRAVVYHLESKTMGRHDRDTENSRVFRMKWQDKIVGDDQKYYEEDHITIEVLGKEGNVTIIFAHDRNGNPFWQDAVRFKQQGLFNQAEASYYRALKFNPFDPRKGYIAEELADLYEAQGKHAQAEELRQQAAPLTNRLGIRKETGKIQEMAAAV